MNILPEWKVLLCFIQERVLFHVYFWETNGRNVPKKHGTKAVRPLNLFPSVIFWPCFFFLTEIQPIYTYKHKYISRTHLYDVFVWLMMFYKLLILAGGGGGRNFRVMGSFQTGFGGGVGSAFPSAATFPHYAIQQGIPYNVYGYEYALTLYSMLLLFLSLSLSLLYSCTTKVGSWHVHANSFTTKTPKHIFLLPLPCLAIATHFISIQPTHHTYAALERDFLSTLSFFSFSLSLSLMCMKTPHSQIHALCLHYPLLLLLHVLTLFFPYSFIAIFQVLSLLAGLHLPYGLYIFYFHFYFLFFSFSTLNLLLRMRFLA